MPIFESFQDFSLWAQQKSNPVKPAQERPAKNRGKTKKQRKQLRMETKHEESGAHIVH